MRTDFLVTLLGDVAIGSRGTLVGARRGCDFLPGHVFLGAAAARLYASLGDDAWTVFHSGKVRFHDAHPIYGESVGFPAARCWHSRGKADLALGPVAYYNLSHPDDQTGTDFRRIDAAYITEDGFCPKPDTGLQLKTAINPATGRAADEKLYSYHVIKRGGGFRFCLRADGISESLYAKVAKSLTGKLRLGSSRSAEYGLVSVEPMEVSKPLESKPFGSEDKRVLLQLLANLVVLDDWGQPSVCPKPQWVGLPPGRLVLDRSFLAHNSATPFNAALRRREWERQFLQAGSVLCFEFDQAPDWESLQQRCRRGLGLFRQNGFGRVWLNPPPLARRQWKLQKALPEAKPESGVSEEINTKTTKPNHPLVHWLVDRVSAAKGDEEARFAGEKWALSLEKCYSDACMLAALPQGRRVGPSPSQWGRVRDLARDKTQNLQSLRQALFEVDGCLCKQGDPEWDVETLVTGKRAPVIGNFATWLSDLLCEDNLQSQGFSLDLVPRALAHLARRGISIARQQDEEVSP